jgi:hypothetical protein
MQQLPNRRDHRGHFDLCNMAATWEDLDDAGSAPVLEVPGGAAVVADPRAAALDAWPVPPAAAAPLGSAAEDDEVDDRPVLLINWTAATAGEVTRARLLADAVDHMAWDARRAAVLADFNLQSELLFARRHALHSTTRRCDADLELLAQLHPDAHYGALPYPARIADNVVDVDEAWTELLRPSTSPAGTTRGGRGGCGSVRGAVPGSPWLYCSVTAFKHVLRQSSHTLLWKVLMAEELDVLAAGPHRAEAEDSDAAAQLSVLDRVLAMMLDRTPQFQPDHAHVQVRGSACATPRGPERMLTAVTGDGAAARAAAGHVGARFWGFAAAVTVDQRGSVQERHHTRHARAAVLS